MSFLSFFSSSTPVNGTNSANSGTAPQTSSATSTAKNSVSTCAQKTIKQQIKITETSSNKTLKIDIQDVDLEPSLLAKVANIGLNLGGIIVGSLVVLNHFYGTPLPEERLIYWTTQRDIY